MKRKIVIVAAKFFVLFFLLFIGGLMLFTIFDILNNDVESTGFYWLPEESYFAGYEIVNENTVRFKYSICFVNESDEDMVISLSAKFKKKELKGWTRTNQTRFFYGYNEQLSPLKAEIKVGEKRNVTVVFEGEYLGGKVNENLSFPEEMLLGWESP